MKKLIDEVSVGITEMEKLSKELNKVVGKIGNPETKKVLGEFKTEFNTVIASMVRVLVQARENREVNLIRVNTNMLKEVIEALPGLKEEIEVAIRVARSI